ncbi:RdgB/HAM1 family non-canonical purine NTP pyrophosphatase [Allorhodopirellula heiligendammensis]|uniref:dITP/XTP pyrophosphatase n=1 Tax=Allorhodopirellula heiligendammensis TaxID=2714739 RepID=A0A5C6BZD5_9BACT|nr:RdgB/HAM1 family non-canonical purine NTP pyrophosphatase [Allorhodopirellula heiligendammensis]TWU16596.1 Non-canonical purine NTP pyrophosphatase [Allorhodopirellula heiligendammensis]
MFDLVLGTHNAKKLIELRMMVPASLARLSTLADIEGAIDVVEDGDTFAENAAKKASEQAQHLGRWVLAEDSGLSVDALDGRPGVYSARYAGEHGNDAANNQKLLSDLRDVPAEKRGAQFNCHLSLADPAGQVHLTASGICRGRIAESLSGSAGFGYDPLFIIGEYHRTFGELDLSVKRAISHRSRALRRFLPQLSRLIQQQSV